MDTSTYRHWDVGYGPSPQYSKAQGVQHSFITPGQHRHVNKNMFGILVNLKVIFKVQLRHSKIERLEFSELEN